MASKVFLDANFVLDLTLRREHFEISRKIFERIVEGKIIAFVSPSIIQICAYYLEKNYGAAKTKEILSALLSDTTCIDIPHDQIVSALHSPIRDIEDAIQYQTAIFHGLDFFISRDKALHKESFPTLPVYSPEEFLAEVDL